MRLWKVTGTKRGRKGSQLIRAENHEAALRVASKSAIIESVALYTQPAQQIAERKLAAATHTALATK